MPRYWRRWHGRTRPNNQNRIWIPTAEEIKIGKGGTAGDTTLSQGQIYKLFDVHQPLTDFDVTLERMRGQAQTVQAGSGALIPAVIFGYIHQNRAVADADKGAQITDGAIPDPMNRDMPQDFPLIMDACAPLTTGSNAGVGPNLEIDSKARRRVNKDDTFTLAVKLLDRSLGTDSSNLVMLFSLALRALYRFKT